jgi:hypothetical protein
MIDKDVFGIQVESAEIQLLELSVPWSKILTEKIKINI